MLLSYNLDYNPLSKYQNMILYIFNFFISFKFLWEYPKHADGAT